MTDQYTPNPGPDYGPGDATTPQPAPAPAGEPPRKKLAPALIAVLAVAAVVVAGVGIAAVNWAASTLFAAQTILPQPEPAPGPLETAADICDTGELLDDDATLVLDMEGEDRGTGDATLADLECLLEQLDTPSSTTNKMMETRALDGRQGDDWTTDDDVTISASWSYHPDDGLDVIFEIED